RLLHCEARVSALQPRRRERAVALHLQRPGAVCPELEGVEPARGGTDLRGQGAALLPVEEHAGPRLAPQGKAARPVAEVVPVERPALGVEARLLLAQPLVLAEAL